MTGCVGNQGEWKVKRRRTRYAMKIGFAGIYTFEYSRLLVGNEDWTRKWKLPFHVRYTLNS